ncbi:hypothetical protein G6O45_23675, partial [Salmonella enterica subsp. enterica serovar Istanbul]|nr:hypothetical protein [Salmonella enterica subsp. enterica serovar Istanbul]
RRVSTDRYMRDAHRAESRAIRVGREVAQRRRMKKCAGYGATASETATQGGGMFATQGGGMF